MYRTIATILAALALRFGATAAQAGAAPAVAADCAAWYGGVSAQLLLPGNANAFRRAPEIAVRAGWYFAEAAALEIEGRALAHGALKRGGSTAAGGIAARTLWHLAGIEFVDKLFGYERFDPFVTLGAAADFAGRGVWGRSGELRRTAFGPEIGAGFYYHLTERWSLRADVSAAMAVGGPCAMAYRAAVGLVASFGGGEEL